jgi:hypothetical protein
MLVVLFALFFLATVLFGSGGTGSAGSAVIYILFVFFLFDVVAAVLSMQLARSLGSYKQVRLANEIAPATGAGGASSRSGGATASHVEYLEAVDQADAVAWRAADASGVVLLPRAARARQVCEAARSGAGGSSSGASQAREEEEEEAVPPPGGSAMGTCSVCMQQPVDTLLYDCGHLVCGACSQQLMRRFGHCPFCRKRIRDTVHMFAA